MGERRVLVAGKVAVAAVERIDVVCARRGVNRSEAVREAFGLWLDRFDPRADRIQRPVREPAVIPTAAGLPAVVEAAIFDPWADVPEAPAVNTDVESEQMPVWGTDRYGRPQWQGPVDADGNPDPGDAA